MDNTEADLSSNKNNSAPSSNSKPITDKDEQKTGNNKKRRRRVKRKKGSNKELDDPMKIVESVLANSSFKKANLSELIEKHFDNPENRKELLRSLKGVSYSQTVGVVSETKSDVDISILPKGHGDIEINLSPSAITNVNCIYEQAPKRWRRQKNKKNHNEKNPESASVKNGTKKVDTEKVEESNVAMV